MSFLRSMDLYKGIVLASLVLLPLGGWWCWKLDESLKSCSAAIEEARRPGGLLEQIGGLKNKVEIVASNRLNTSDTINMERKYFEGQLLAAGGGQLKPTDFSITDSKEDPQTVPGSRQKVTDFVVDVNWPDKKLAVQMSLVYAVLFNCESGATAAGGAQQSIWKLRSLTLENMTSERISTATATPPPELEDRWQIRKMQFARREPRKS